MEQKIVTNTKDLSQAFIKDCVNNPALRAAASDMVNQFLDSAKAFTDQLQSLSELLASLDKLFAVEPFDQETGICGYCDAYPKTFQHTECCPWKIAFLKFSKFKSLFPELFK